MFSSRRSLFYLGVIAAMPFAVSLSAQEGPQTTRVLIRAESKGDAVPALRPADVAVEVAGRDLPVLGVSPLLPSRALSGRAPAPAVEVAVVLDDGLRSNFAVNLRELTAFVRGTVSSTTSVGIGYMRNGSVYFSKGFSTDPEVAAKAMRIPLGSPGASASPYFCLQDLVKHWPTQTGASHVVLMITNGIDYYNGSVSPLNQNSPYVDEAIRNAQRAAVPVYSVYFGGRDVNGLYSSASGQSYLAKVAEETGGLSFNQGQITPPSIAPFLKQFQQALSATYVVAFQDSGRSLQRLKVKTSLAGVKLRAQQQVRAGQMRGGDRD